VPAPISGRAVPAGRQAAPALIAMMAGCDDELIQAIALALVLIAVSE
jgi:hypothetical protein